MTGGTGTIFILIKIINTIINSNDFKKIEKENPLSDIQSIHPSTRYLYHLSAKDRVEAGDNPR